MKVEEMESSAAPVLIVRLTEAELREAMLCVSRCMDRGDTDDMDGLVALYEVLADGGHHAADR